MNLPYSPEETTLGGRLNLTEEQIEVVEAQVMGIIASEGDIDSGKVFIDIPKKVMEIEAQMDKDPVFKRSLLIKLVFTVLNDMQETGAIEPAKAPHEDEELN